MAFRLALCQFSPQKARLDENIARIGEVARQALKEGADVVAFPESAATGYILEGGASDVAISADELLRRVSAEIGVPSRQVDLLVGFYEAAAGQPYNSAAYLTVGPAGDLVVHVHRKVFLPTYRLFDEERFHQPGGGFHAFDTRFGRFGAMICEDCWHSLSGTLLALDGAQVVLVPSASPVRDMAEETPGNVLRYERMLRGLSEEHGVFSAAILLTGFEGGKGFSGGSFAFDPFGSRMVSAAVGEEALVVCEIDLDVVTLARQRTPLLDDLRQRWDGLVSRPTKSD
ncbi:MAG: hypothetical protein KIT11_05280 [Fimbriimonadaceae bacterium]|nr:hypothetical protein [Fimbriimonadaceae bacterium]QYK56696.1 MAG: hypothetical protein KF733_04240 [Fimbriimonadaceae bacterium]